jgi:hypothetical protein
MALSRAVGLAFVICLAGTMTTYAQTAAVEMQQSIGASTESIAAAGTQGRVFGEAIPGLHFLVEGAWGTRSEDVSDVFGTAYPYSGEVDIIEAYGEYQVPPSRGVMSIKAGRYRTPFGIYSASDHAYLGFLRAPLIRYGEYYALSSGYLEHGADIVVGVPRASVEVSVGRPADVGEAIRRTGVDTVVRAQAVAGAFVVGASFIDTTPYMPERFAAGRARFGGVDVRWMKDGVQLRGEWLGGRPFDGTQTTGGYVDVIVHRPVMGPVTALGRVERLDYDSDPQFALATQRYWAGARIRFWKGLATSFGVGHQTGQMTQSRRTAFDVGLTLALRAGL